MRKWMWQLNQKLFLHWKQNVQLLRQCGEICHSLDVGGVCLFSLGSRGDVEPMLTMAIALTASGYRVTACGPSSYAAKAKRFGFGFRSIGIDESPGDEVAWLDRTLAVMDQAVEAVTEATVGCDAVMSFSALSFAAAVVSDAKCLPRTHFEPSPCSVDRTLYPPCFDPGTATCSVEDAWAAFIGSYNQRSLEVYNATRQEMGINPVACAWESVLTTDPVLAADKSLYTWSGRQVGALVHDDGSSLPGELTEFTSGGDAVCVTFGSTPVSNQMVDSAVEAAGDSPVVLVGGTSQEPNVMCVESVNYFALFPRCRLVIHHGGAGTSTIAAMSGAKQLILPQIYDQFFWKALLSE